MTFTLIFVLICQIRSISIPSHVKTICKSAFAFSKFKEITFSEDSELNTIESSVFFHSKLNELSISSRLVELQKGWCDGAIKLTKISRYLSFQQVYEHFHRRNRREARNDRRRPLQHPGGADEGVARLLLRRRVGQISSEQSRRFSLKFGLLEGEASRRHRKNTVLPFQAPEGGHPLQCPPPAPEVEGDDAEVENGHGLARALHGPAELRQNHGRCEVEGHS